MVDLVLMAHRAWDFSDFCQYYVGFSLRTSSLR